MRLSENFYLEEFLRSQTAQRQGGAMLRDQTSPSAEILDNLQYLVENTLQPLRTLLQTPFQVSSGYRSPALNTHIGGSPTSQHLLGEAADVIMSDSFLRDDNGRETRARLILDNRIYEVVGRSLRPDCTSNFYLFAAACLYINETDIDQVIHEFGDPGRPSWVHMSSSRRRNKREMLIIGANRRESLTLEEALLLGC